LFLLQVVTAGQYEITLYYQSDEDATFRLWVGPHSKIEDGTAMHLDARLPADVSRCRQSSAVVGYFNLAGVAHAGLLMQLWHLQLSVCVSFWHKQTISCGGSGELL
jgi:hypothetical protein